MYGVYKMQYDIFIQKQAFVLDGNLSETENSVLFRYKQLLLYINFE